MRVGLMMVVRNEVHRIEACLEHHVKYFDHVVICDQQSDDGTWGKIMDFAKNTPVTITALQDENYGHCAPSRQKTLDLLAADWAVMVDADEKFPIDFLETMHIKAVKGDQHGVDGYTLQRRNSFDVQVYDETVAAEPKWLYVEHPIIEKQFRFFAKQYATFGDGLHSRVHFNHGRNEAIGHLPDIIEHRKTLAEMHADLQRFRAVKGLK